MARYTTIQLREYQHRDSISQKQIEALTGQCRLFREVIHNDSLLFTLKRDQLAQCDKDLSDSEKRAERAEKRAKRNGNMAKILAGTTGILAALLFLF